MAEPRPLRVLIVDDEPLARLRLRSLLESIPEPRCEIAGEAADAGEARRWIERHAIDVLLLDIRMPGPDGLQLAAALRALPRPPVPVFVTAHAEHALAAFDLDAADYLTKPVRRERLQAALMRARQRLPAAAGVASRPVIVVHDRGRVLRLPVDEVLYLKAEQKYVTLRTVAASYVLDDALSDLEQRLAAQGAAFVRVHRNAIVARHAVRALERRSEIPTISPDLGGDPADDGWAVRVAPSDEWLAVSRRQLAAVRAALDDRPG